MSVPWTAQARVVVSSPTPRVRGVGGKEIWKGWVSESSNAGLESMDCVVGLLSRCESDAEVGFVQVRYEGLT